MKKSFLCSGQGSQYVGMMKDLYEKYPKAKEIIDKADSVLGYKLSEICFEGPVEKLKETRYTQPALFLHSAVVYELIKDNVEADATAGHSVGEIAALYIAGALSFEDALKLVSLRGKLMFEAGEERPGTMFAVIGMDDDTLKELCNKLNDNPDGNVCVPANYNSPGQIVISGSRDYLRENAGKFKESGARMVKELVVSGAFHSPLMQPAKEILSKAIKETEFMDPKIPVYTNVYAKAEKDPQALKEALVSQLTSPVLWTQTLSSMESNGIKEYIELGPGNVLQGLVKRTLKDVSIAGYDKAGDVEKIIS